MRRGLWWKSSLCRILIVLALLGGTFSAQAQTSSDRADEEEDAKSTPSLSVNIVFSDEGSVQVNFFAFGQPSTSSEIKTALESSLGCTLQARAPFRHTITQVYSGSCEPTFLRTSTTREFRIATAPLRQFALDHQIETLSLDLRLPDVEIAETQPPVQGQSLAFRKMPAILERNLELSHSYLWHTDSAIPEFVTVRFGLSAHSIARTECILLGVLLFPALLVFWMGRKALSSQAQDKAVVWFTYMRYLQWTLNFSLLGWWIAADSLHLVRLLQFLSAGTRIAPIWDYAITPTIVEWFPPAVIWVLSFALSHPVQERLRGLTWTRGELAIQGIYSFCASLLPLPCSSRASPPLRKVGFKPECSGCWPPSPSLSLRAVHVKSSSACSLKPLPQVICAITLSPWPASWASSFSRSTSSPREKAKWPMRLRAKAT
jgi:hypothetical protein